MGPVVGGGGYFPSHYTIKNLVCFILKVGGLMDWSQMWAIGFVLRLLSVQTEKDEEVVLHVLDKSHTSKSAWNMQ